MDAELATIYHETEDKKLVIYISKDARIFAEKEISYKSGLFSRDDATLQARRYAESFNPATIKILVN